MLVDLLRFRTVSYLKAQKNAVEAIMKSVMRPKEVLLKHKELIRKAARDESTLVSLENQLILVELEKARLEKPWELITKPEILEKPYSPRKINFLFYGLFIGFLFSSSFAYWKEFKLGIIFDIDKFSSNLKAPIIQILTGDKLNNDSDEITFLKEYLDIKSEANLNFLLPLNISEFKIKKLEKSIFKFKNTQKNNSARIINSIKDFKELSDNETNFLILEFGFVKMLDIKKIKNYAEIYNINFDGIILV